MCFSLETPHPRDEPKTPGVLANSVQKEPAFLASWGCRGESGRPGWFPERPCPGPQAPSHFLPGGASPRRVGATSVTNHTPHPREKGPGEGPLSALRTAPAEPAAAEFAALGHSNYTGGVPRRERAQPPTTDAGWGPGSAPPAARRWTGAHGAAHGTRPHRTLTPESDTEAQGLSDLEKPLQQQRGAQ